MMDVSRTSSSSTPISSSQRTKSPVRVQRTIILETTEKPSSTHNESDVAKTREKDAKALRLALTKAKINVHPSIRANLLEFVAKNRANAQQPTE